MLLLRRAICVGLSDANARKAAVKRAMTEAVLRGMVYWQQHVSTGQHSEAGSRLQIEELSYVSTMIAVFDIIGTCQRSTLSVKRLLKESRT
jgi:hypothetical protein